MKKISSFTSMVVDPSNGAEVTQDHATPMINNIVSEGKFLVRARIVAVVALLLFTGSFAQAVTKTAATGNWNTAGTWTPSGVPVSTDDIVIPNGVTLTGDITTTCLSITFTGASAILTINASVTVTVTNAVTLNSSVTNSSACTIQGTGSLSCNSVTVGTDTHPATPSVRTTIMTSTLTNFSVSNNLTILSSIGNNTGRLINSTFNLASGTTSISGSIQTTNENAINVSTFSMITGAQTGTLILSGATPFSQSGTGTSTFSLNGTQATVIFNSAGSQTIPAFNYNNLTSQGTGARILASSGTIGIAGTFTPGSSTYTTTGSTVAFNGSGSQTIPAFNYYNLTGGGTGPRTLASSGTIGIAGTFAIGLSAYTVTGSTVDFNGGGAQSIPSFTFNNLITSNSGTKTIAAGTSVRVLGNLTTNGLLSIESESLTSNGSLIVDGVSTGNVTYNRYLRADDYHFFTSPVSGQAISGFASGRPGTSVVEWNEPSGTWPVPAETNFIPGKGYGWYQTAAIPGKVSFTGTLLTAAGPITATSPYLTYSSDYTGPYVTGRDPDDGNDLDGVYGGGGWNLLGNPFTSALRITDDAGSGDDGNSENDFLAKNLASFDPSYQAIYIYNGTVGLHGAYYYIAKPVPFTDPITGEDPANADFSNKYIQAGQGFYVLARENGVTFSFTAAMRAHNTSVPMTKSANAGNSWPGLHLKVKYGELENYTTVIFNDKMTLDLDPGYDVGQLSTSPEMEIYTSLALKDNSVNFARQALPVAGADKTVIPVGVDYEKGGEVTFSAYTVPIDSKKFWLEDKTTGIFTDLTTKSYTVTLPAKTYGTGRFFIIASANTPTGIKLPQAEGTDVRIWISNDKVIIKGEVSEKARCEIYNVNGKKIVDAPLTSGELNTIDMPSSSNGVYIVRVTDGVKVTTRKIALL